MWVKNSPWTDKPSFDVMITIRFVEQEKFLNKIKLHLETNQN